MRVKTELELIEDIRERRRIICFPVINRGLLWYNTLTIDQLQKLKQWYKSWLDATVTKKIPETPNFVNTVSTSQIVNLDGLDRLGKSTNEIHQIGERLSFVEGDVAKLKAVVNDPLDF